jgi:signal transduction histidine kinase
MAGSPGSPPAAATVAAVSRVFVTMTGIVAYRPERVIGAWVQPAAPPPGGAGSTQAPMTPGGTRAYASGVTLVHRVRDSFTRSAIDPCEKAPPEVPWLRAAGWLTLFAFVATSVAVEPHPGFGSLREIAILVGVIVWAALVWSAVPMRPLPEGLRVARVAIVSAVTLGLYALQPEAIWFLMPYVVASVSGVRLPPRPGALLYFGSLLGTVAVGMALGRTDHAISIAIGTLPWFLFMRLMRRQREEHDVTKGLLRDLEASRAAEAAAAADAERSRLAREMHDVLAHSLSALALQLESTRLLAHDRHTDPEVARAIERAHGLAASGLEDARRAIGALRGEDLPGPQRLPALVEASGLPVALDVSGEPRELAPDARLALYRTAQEALTNVRRHATANRVELRLAYRDDGTVLTVADHGEGPPPAAVNGHGYGLTGMRERAELLGGRLSAAPTHDGFRVELWLPA